MYMNLQYDVSVLVQCMKRWSDNSAWIFEKLVWYSSVNEWKITGALKKLGWFFSINLWMILMMLQWIKMWYIMFQCEDLAWRFRLEWPKNHLPDSFSFEFHQQAMLDHRNLQCFNGVPMFYNPLHHSLYI